MAPPLKIVHVFRAAFGGLFRHVCDLAREQAASGQHVGIICDSTTGGAVADSKLAELKDLCALGIHRIAMHRLPGLGDMICARRVAQISRKLELDVIHGHGAKGGVYARLAAARIGAQGLYTPHGGVLHYAWASPQGAIFLAAERLLLRKTHGLVFVCNHERDLFAEKIGLGKAPNLIAHNGLRDEEFIPVKPAKAASDLLYVGELRKLKGADVLISAVAELNRSRRTTLTVVGDGEDRQEFEALARRLRIDDVVRFTGAMPAREAFRRGKLLIVPSRAESFPYIVLEAAAAQLPLIASRVGGIPEVLEDDVLVEAGNAEALAAAIAGALADPQDIARVARGRAERFRDGFSSQRMAGQIAGFYQELLNRRHDSEVRQAAGTVPSPLGQ